VSFKYPSFRITEIAKAPKVVRAEKLVFESRGERGRSLKENLDLINGEILDLRLIVQCGRFDMPTTYSAALILSDSRIRGIDYSTVSLRRFGKIRVPRGWHENIVDPNLDSRHDDANRHEPMPNFNATDLDNFLSLTAKHWNINLPDKEELL
jgi:hypothetical protein